MFRYWPTSELLGARPSMDAMEFLARARASSRVSSLIWVDVVVLESGPTYRIFSPVAISYSQLPLVTVPNLPFGLAYVFITSSGVHLGLLGSLRFMPYEAWIKSSHADRISGMPILTSKPLILFITPWFTNLES